MLQGCSSEKREENIKLHKVLPDILREGRFFPEFVLDRDLVSGDLYGRSG